MKDWFMTNRGEIIDLNMIQYITIERDKMVLASHNGGLIVLGEFKNREECLEYTTYLFKRLNENR